MQTDVDLTIQTCGSCGCVFGFPTSLHNQRLADGQGWYCPNGHCRVFSKGQTEADKLRREVAALRQNKAYLEDRRKEAEDRAEHERRRANGYKGHATKITKRAKAGVCICCNRTFQDLARHMASKHPTLTPMELDDRPAEGATVQ